MNDRYGLPLSTTSTAAADAYVRAVDALLGAGAGLIEGFESALRLDPAFALAEIGRARCLATYGIAAQARASAARANELVAGATVRERSHVAALALAVEGRGAEALTAIRQHLAEFPRDAMVLQPATGIFGLIGFSGRLEREAELLAMLDGLAPHHGEDWWFTSIHAFAECEAGRLAEAERRIERSLAANPGNGNAAHVRAHVYYERDQPREGAAFLRAWLERYSRQGLLRGHLTWHLALLELGLGDAQAAWALYEREFGAALQGAGPLTPPLNILTDAASWLWRAELHGEARRDAEWHRLAAYAVERFPHAGVPFADIHAGLAWARIQDRAELKRLNGELDELSRERPACGTAMAYVSGFLAHAEGDWMGAAQRLGAHRDESARVGGSHAQRELVDRTLLSAWRNARSADEERALIGKRPQLAAGA